MCSKHAKAVMEPEKVEEMERARPEERQERLRRAVHDVYGEEVLKGLTLQIVTEHTTLSERFGPDCGSAAAALSGTSHPGTTR